MEILCQYPPTFDKDVNLIAGISLGNKTFKDVENMVNIINFLRLSWIEKGKTSTIPTLLLADSINWINIRYRIIPKIRKTDNCCNKGNEEVKKNKSIKQALKQGRIIYEKYILPAYENLKSRFEDFPLLIINWDDMLSQNKDKYNRYYEILKQKFLTDTEFKQQILNLIAPIISSNEDDYEGEEGVQVKDNLCEYVLQETALSGGGMSYNGIYYNGIVYPVEYPCTEMADIFKLFVDFKPDTSTNIVCYGIGLALGSNGGNKKRKSRKNKKKKRRKTQRLYTF